MRSTSRKWRARSRPSRLIQWRAAGDMGGTAFHRDVIIALAAKHRLPAVYPYRYFVSGGGLISYGPDTIDQYRRAAEYIDRIFKGERRPTCRYRRQPSTSS